MPKDFIIFKNVGLWQYLLYANLTLAIFNLTPALPMDGGRILRAILSFKFDKVKATFIAVRVAQGLAILMVIVGFFVNIWLIFIALFVFFGANSEYKYERTKAILKKHNLKEVLMTNFSILSPYDSLKRGADFLLNGQEQDFVIIDEGQPVGILTRATLLDGLKKTS